MTAVHSFIAAHPDLSISQKEACKDFTDNADRKWARWYSFDQPGDDYQYQNFDTEEQCYTFLAGRDATVVVTYWDSGLSKIRYTCFRKYGIVVSNLRPWASTSGTILGNTCGQNLAAGTSLYASASCIDSPSTNLSPLKSGCVPSLYN
ncbi:hypothetical protein EMMF5_000817, partial [Cystobasidiomycetes sp. EMM_F5]